MYDIVNSWQNVHLFCCKNHKEPQEMELLNTPKAIFYACPKYFEKNREDGEPACINPVYLNDVEKAVKKINDMVGAAAMADNELNLENVKFTIDNVDYTVLKDDNGVLDIAVENRKVVRK